MQVFYFLGWSETITGDQIFGGTKGEKSLHAVSVHPHFANRGGCDAYL